MPSDRAKPRWNHRGARIQAHHEKTALSRRVEPQKKNDETCAPRSQANSSRRWREGTRGFPSPRPGRTKNGIRLQANAALHQAAWNGQIEVGVAEGAVRGEGCEYGWQRKCG